MPVVDHSSPPLIISHPTRTTTPILTKSQSIFRRPTTFQFLHPNLGCRITCRLLIIPPPPDHLSSNSHNDPHSDEIFILVHHSQSIFRHPTTFQFLHPNLGGGSYDMHIHAKIQEEASNQYTTASRPDLAQKELAEASILKSFLP